MRSFITQTRFDEESGQTCWVVPSDLEVEYPLGARVCYRILGGGRVQMNVISEETKLAENEFEGRVIPLVEHD